VTPPAHCARKIIAFGGVRMEAEHSARRFRSHGSRDALNTVRTGRRSGVRAAQQCWKHNTPLSGVLSQTRFRAAEFTAQIIDDIFKKICIRFKLFGVADAAIR
jgi:hypothetical protein